MFRHRILIVGAPASGRGWMAGRIVALAGIPPATGGPPRPDEREWLRITDDVDVVRELQPDADLIVLMRTPVWLRWLRLVRRTASTARRHGRRLPARLAATGRWDRVVLPEALPLLERGPGRLIQVRSSENVRTVLECVLGLDRAVLPGDLARTR